MLSLSRGGRLAAGHRLALQNRAVARRASCRCAHRLENTGIHIGITLHTQPSRDSDV